VSGSDKMKVMSPGTSGLVGDRRRLAGAATFALDIRRCAHKSRTTATANRGNNQDDKLHDFGIADSIKITQTHKHRRVHSLQCVPKCFVGRT
jgi:hypothetical protein